MIGMNKKIRRDAEAVAMRLFAGFGERMLVLCFVTVAAALQCGADWRDALPRPVYDERPEFVDFYFKTWEIAHGRIDNIPGLPVPRYMDEAHRSDRIWVWDTCFMVFFCKYLPEEFPGVESLENFYEIMLAPDDAPLPKVVGNSACWGPEGCLEGKLLDFKIHHPDNPPIFAWAEYAHALQTGDKARLEKVYAEKRWLQRWYEMFDAFDPAAPQPHGTAEKVRIKKCADGYHWAGWPSGMDNSPRGKTGAKAECDPDLCPDNPDLLWLDALAQQGLSALCLSRIAELLGRADEATAWRAKWAEARDKLNTLYWDETDGFYYDILESNRAKVKVATIASFWPMLAEMPTRAMADRLEEKLRDPRTFGGELPMPCLSRSDPDFLPGGGYCRGCLWLPTAYMTVKALDAYGDWALAREMSLKTLAHMYNVYTNVEPHTIWEDYSPTEAKPGSYAKSPAFVRPDFCGWSALGPISMFMEDVIGVKSADAFANTLVCDFPKAPEGRVGVENYRFGKVVCDIAATADEIKVKSSRPFTLIADGRRLSVAIGDSTFNRHEE